MKKNPLLLLLLLVSWREILLLLSQYADFLLKYSPSFPYGDHMLAITQLPRWVYSWANFDGVHYLTIITMGYWGIGLIQAFFPLYPLTVRFISEFTQSQPLTNGMYVSMVSLFVFLNVWGKNLSERYGENFAWKILITVLLFPTAFFLGAVYSESFFLMWVVLSWHFIKRKSWVLAGISMMIASGTRVIGIFLVPATLLNIWVEEYSQYAKLKLSGIEKISKSILSMIQHHWKKIGWVLLGVLGIVGYMVFLYLRYGDPLAFFHVQSEFGAGRTTYIVTLPQVIWRSLRILQTVDHNSWKYFSYLQDTVISLLFLGLWGIGAVHRHRYKLSWGELMFSAVAFLLPTLTGTFSSMPRYVLACLPLFIVLTFQLSTTKSYYSWLAISTFLLILNTLLFIQGYWVA